VLYLLSRDLQNYSNIDNYSELLKSYSELVKLFKRLLMRFETIQHVVAACGER